MSYPAPYNPPPPQQPPSVPAQSSPQQIFPQVPPENRAPVINTPPVVEPTISNFATHGSLSSFDEKFGNLDSMSSMYAPF